MLTVKWEIDSDETDPVEAAHQVWRDTFGREYATNSDACVFDVVGPDGAVTRVDLSEHQEEED